MLYGFLQGCCKVASVQTWVSDTLASIQPQINDGCSRLMTGGWCKDCCFRLGYNCMSFHMCGTKQKAMSKSGLVLALCLFRSLARSCSFALSFLHS